MAKHLTQQHLTQQRAFAAHIRDPQKVPVPAGIEARRMKIYSDLFFNNVKGFLDGTFPVCAEVIGESRWHDLARSFFARHRCQTPYFLEIPREFLSFLEQGADSSESDPDYLYELAHYEWLELAVDVCQESVAERFDANASLAHSIPVLAAAAQAFVYQYPVHQISTGNVAPEKRQTALIVFRDRQDQVRFIETNLMTLQLQIILQQQELTGTQAVEQLLQQSGMAVTEVALQGGLTILEEWRQQGLILGGR